MEFLGGILLTLFIEFIAWKIYKARERRKVLGTYIPPSKNRNNKLP